MFLTCSRALLAHYFTDGIHCKEANVVKSPVTCCLQVEEEEEGGKAAPQGFLSEVFGGELSSRVACEVCHHTSLTLEPFMDLSLPIPSATLADMDDSTPDRSAATLQSSASAPAHLQSDKVPLASTCLHGVQPLSCHP